MKVYHETFGTGKVLASTERLDESGSIVAGDVMFEHGIELDLPLFEVTYSAKKAAAGEDIGKPGKEFKKIAAKAAAKYGSKAAGGRVAGAVLKKLRNEEVEDLDEGQKKSSFGAGTISVGYRGKKYKSEFKAHKAAVRAVKKGSEDPNIYQYGSRNEDAEQIDEKQDAEKAHHDALWSKFREIHGPLPGGRGAQDKYNQKWTAYKAANPMKEDTGTMVQGTESSGKPAVTTPNPYKKGHLPKQAKQGETYGEEVEALDEEGRVKLGHVNAGPDAQKQIDALKAKHKDTHTGIIVRTRGPHETLPVPGAGNSTYKTQPRGGMQSKTATGFAVYGKPKTTNEEVEALDEKLVGGQKNIDKNKNGKIDSQDFKMLRGEKKEMPCEDVNMTPAAADLRMPVVENVVRSILSQGRNLRQEAKIAEFKSRK